MLQREHSAILSTFIKLPSVIKIFVLSIFELPLKTGACKIVNVLLYSGQNTTISKRPPHRRNKSNNHPENDIYSYLRINT